MLPMLPLLPIESSNHKLMCIIISNLVTIILLNFIKVDLLYMYKKHLIYDIHISYFALSIWMELIVNVIHLILLYHKNCLVILSLTVDSYFFRYMYRFPSNFLLCEKYIRHFRSQVEYANPIIGQFLYIDSYFWKIGCSFFSPHIPQSPQPFDPLTNWLTINQTKI